MIDRRGFLVAIAAAPLASCGILGPAHRGEPEPGAAVVEMSGYSFVPARLEVRAGQTVEWRNASFFTHTVTCDPAKAKDPRHIELPAGAEAFDSGRIPPGEIWRRSFPAPGTYRCVCLPHEEDGMLGTVVVRA